MFGDRQVTSPEPQLSSSPQILLFPPKPRAVAPFPPSCRPHAHAPCLIQAHASTAAPGCPISTNTSFLPPARYPVSSLPVPAPFSYTAPPFAVLLVGLSNAPAHRLGNALADRPVAARCSPEQSPASLSVVWATAARPSLSATCGHAPPLLARPSDRRVAVAHPADGHSPTPTALQHEEPLAAPTVDLIASCLSQARRQAAIVVRRSAAQGHLRHSGDRRICCSAPCLRSSRRSRRWLSHQSDLKCLSLPLRQQQGDSHEGPCLDLQLQQLTTQVPQLRVCDRPRLVCQCQYCVRRTRFRHGATSGTSASLLLCTVTPYVTHLLLPCLICSPHLGGLSPCSGYYRFTFFFCGTTTTLSCCRLPRPHVQAKNLPCTSHASPNFAGSAPRFNFATATFYLLNTTASPFRTCHSHPKTAHSSCDVGVPNMPVAQCRVGPRLSGIAPGNTL